MNEHVIRILIAEDIDLVAEAFEVLLNTYPEFVVVGRVGSGDKVAGAATALTPDVVLLDVDLPGLDGIAATAQVRAAAPECRVLLLTAFPGPGHIPRALEAGASGYVVKTLTAEDLAAAIHEVASGGTVIDSQLAAEALRSGQNPLVPREIDVLRLVESDISTREIANTLHLTQGTVRNYLSDAMTKLGSETRQSAARLAKQKGWI